MPKRRRRALRGGYGLGDLINQQKQSHSRGYTNDQEKEVGEYMRRRVARGEANDESTWNRAYEQDYKPATADVFTGQEFDPAIKTFRSGKNTKASRYQRNAPFSVANISDAWNSDTAQRILRPATEAAHAVVSAATGNPVSAVYHAVNAVNETQKSARGKSGERNAWDDARTVAGPLVTLSGKGKHRRIKGGIGRRGAARMRGEEAFSSLMGTLGYGGRTLIGAGRCRKH